MDKLNLEKDYSKKIEDIDIEKIDTFRKVKDTPILTIMFMDMVDSTSLRIEMGEEKFEALRLSKKDQLMPIIESEDKGKFIKDLGDGYLAVFTSPSEAVETALTIQSNISTEDKYKLRIGLDMGQVTRELEESITLDIFGNQVNRAARIESLSEGGHILTSIFVYDSAVSWLKHNNIISWKKHGKFFLKGIEESIDIYEPYDNQNTIPLQILKRKTDESCIKIYESTNQGKEIRIDTCAKFITIGRSPKSDVQLLGNTVSWEHGNILYSENEYLYRHVSKVNPTYIKRRDGEFMLRKDLKKDITLKNDDRIFIGDNTLIVNFDLHSDSIEYSTTQPED